MKSSHIISLICKQRDEISQMTRPMPWGERVIEQTLAKTGGNIIKAATILNVSRPALHD